MTQNATISFAVLNVTRPIHRTKQTTQTAAGAVDTVVKYEEGSRSTYNVRGSYTW